MTSSFARANKMLVACGTSNMTFYDHEEAEYKGSAGVGKKVSFSLCQIKLSAVLIAEYHSSYVTLLKRTKVNSVFVAGIICFPFLCFL